MSVEARKNRFLGDLKGLVISKEPGGLGGLTDREYGE
jgi:hypothetical protein